MTLSPV